jgi:plasmid stabilization system protein ParE
MRVSWSSPATEDLQAINGWLVREASPEFAIRTLLAIRERAAFLARFPHSGRPHPDGTRILRVFDTPYLIRYRIDADVVGVLRLHHEREDWFIEP